MAAAAILKNRKKSLYVGRGLTDFDKISHSDAVRPFWRVRQLKFSKYKMAAAVILKNRKIAIARQRLNLSPRNLAWWRSLALLIIPIAATSMQPICAIMNFSTDSLERVGCCTSVIFLLLTKLLHNVSHLFITILPNDYLAIAKLWSVYRHLSPISLS